MRLGTRASALALAQASLVARLLEQSGVPAVELVEVRTTGDREAHRPLEEIAGQGAFTKEIEEALLRGEVDIAVHSLKDLPTELPAGLRLAATPAREDVRDALVSCGGLQLEQLPAGARIGTSSQRRVAQVLAARPDVVCVPIRGNVPTRIHKVEAGEFDAAVLALAGLRRLGLEVRATQVFEPGAMLPAVGQGALGLEVRAGDARSLAAAAALNDAATWAAVLAERALLRTLGGGCRTPLGAWGRVEGDVLRLEGCACSLDGARILRAETSGSPSDAEAIGARVAQALAAQGALELLEA